MSQHVPERTGDKIESDASEQKLTFFVAGNLVRGLKNRLKLVG